MPHCSGSISTSTAVSALYSNKCVFEIKFPPQNKEIEIQDGLSLVFTTYRNKVVDACKECASSNQRKLHHQYIEKKGKRGKEGYTSSYTPF